MTHTENNGQQVRRILIETEGHRQEIKLTFLQQKKIHLKPIEAPKRKVQCVMMRQCHVMRLPTRVFIICLSINRPLKITFNLNKVSDK